MHTYLTCRYYGLGMILIRLITRGENMIRGRRGRVGAVESVGLSHLDTTRLKTTHI